MKRRARSASSYIHGFDPVEQKRLLDQAKYLERWVYRGIDFMSARRVLEIGCGVGAQTKILLERFPRLQIDGVDLSESQLAQARHYLRREISDGRVRLFHADASDLTILGRAKYDGAFLCWFLEHVPKPGPVLSEARRLLKPGARLYASEVFNQSFFLAPPSELIESYWRQFNERQIELGGDPNVGPKLGALLSGAGFRKISTEVRALQFDARNRRERSRFLEYFAKLTASGASSLIASGRVDSRSRARIASEFGRLKRNDSTVIHLGFCHAVATR